MELLSPVDLAFCIAAGVSFLLALVAAGGVAIASLSSPPARARIALPFALVQIAALLAGPALMWFAIPAALDRFGAIGLVPILWGLAARAALPLLVAVLAADVTAWLGLRSSTLIA